MLTWVSTGRSRTPVASPYCLVYFHEDVYTTGVKNVVCMLEGISLVSSSEQEQSTCAVICERGRSPFTSRTPMWSQTHRRRSANMGKRARARRYIKKARGEKKPSGTASQVSVTCATSHER